MGTGMGLSRSAIVVHDIGLGMDAIWTHRTMGLRIHLGVWFPMLTLGCCHWVRGRHGTRN